MATGDVSTRDHLLLLGVDFVKTTGSFKRIGSKRYCCSLCNTAWLATLEFNEPGQARCHEVWSREK